MIELRPLKDTAKSFYGKAKTEISENGKIKGLYSYNKCVAFIDNGKATVENTYSATTLRHIKEVLKQNGFKAENKAQILEDYAEVKE